MTRPIMEGYPTYPDTAQCGGLGKETGGKAPRVKCVHEAIQLCSGGKWCCIECGKVATHQYFEALE